MISIRGTDYNWSDWWILKKILECGRQEVYKTCNRNCASCSSRKVCKDLDRLEDYVSFKYNEGK